MAYLGESPTRLRACVRRALGTAARFAASLPALVAPPRCRACAAVLEGDASAPDPPCWCAECAALVVPLGERFCLGCRSAWPAGECRCRAPLALLSALQYGDAVAALVRDAKYEGWEQLLDVWLGLWRIAVGEDGVPAGPLPELLCAVPTHPSRRRERGFAVPERWAQRLAARCARPRVEALRRVRATRPQVGLDRCQRGRNVSGAFAPGPDSAAVRGRSLALVDDVVTSGATVRESANLLRSLGARRVEVWSFAYEPIE